MGVTDSVINIGIEVNAVVETLSRKYDNMSTIRLQLKRSLEYKTSYMMKSIQPSKICDALSYLVNSPLYRKYDATVIPNIDNRYGPNYTDHINFIVDNNNVTQTDTQTFVDLNLYNTNFDNEHFEDKVLVFNRNLESNSENHNYCSCSR